MKTSDHSINSHDMIFSQNQHAVIIKITIKIIIRIKVTEIDNFFNKIKTDSAHNFFIKHLMSYQFQKTIIMKTSSNSMFFQFKIKFHQQILECKTETVIQIINCNTEHLDNFCKKSIT